MISEMKPKVLDCFPYFNEDMILDLRFNILNDFVDYFIIVEAKHNHRGKAKPLNFNLNNFEKFKHKIIYLINENINENPIKQNYNIKAKHESLQRENNQRNTLIQAIDKFDDEDYVIISDADEIPSPNAIEEFKKKKKKYGLCSQKFSYYKFNLVNKHRRKWMGSKMCKKKFLSSPQFLRNISGPRFWDIKKKYFSDIVVLKNGGWHFSFMNSPEKIKLKIQSYTHKEYDNNEIANLDNIKRKIEDKKDIFNRDIKLKKESLDSSYPEYLIKNHIKYKNYLLD